MTSLTLRKPIFWLSWRKAAQQKAEWEEIMKTRADELAALAETIMAINENDALELYQVPQASCSESAKRDFRMDFLGTPQKEDQI